MVKYMEYELTYDPETETEYYFGYSCGRIKKAAVGISSAAFLNEKFAGK